MAKAKGAATTAEEVAAAVRETWIFIGKRIGRDNKIAFVWKTMGNDGEPEYDSDDHYFGSEIVPAMPGALYEFSVLHKNEGAISILGSGRDYKGVYGSTAAISPEQFARRQEWHLRHKAAETEYGMIQRRKKEISSDPIKEHLEPLRAILKKQIGLNRRVMIAEIMEYLTR